MPEKERDHLELALLMLAAREWFLFYSGQERAVDLWQAENLRRLKGFESRAASVYQSSISKFGTFDSPTGGTLLQPSVPRTARLERAISKSYAAAFGARGQFLKRGFKQIDRADRGSADFLKGHLNGARDLAIAAAAEEAEAELAAAAAAVSRGTSRSQSRWALQRDIEQLEKRTRHRAGLSGLAASSGGSSLAASLTEAPRAVRVARSSFQNTLVGTSRHASRQSVYENARGMRVFSGRWVGIAPFKGSLMSHVPLTTAGWAKIARGGRPPSAWSVSNPVGSWGMHVGSRSFFAPLLDPHIVKPLVAGLLLLLPGLPSRLEISSGLSIEPSPVTLDGRPLDSLGQLGREVTKALQKSAASVRPGRRETGELLRQQLATATVALVHQGTSPPLIVLDRGFEERLSRGIVMVVRPQKGPGVRGQIVLTAVYPHSSIAAVVWKAPGGGSFRNGDFATTTGQRALGA